MGMALIGLNDGTEKLNLEGYQREGGEQGEWKIRSALKPNN